MLMLPWLAPASGAVRLKVTLSFAPSAFTITPVQAGMAVADETAFGSMAVPSAFMVAATGKGLPTKCQPAREALASYTNGTSCVASSL